MQDYHSANFMTRNPFPLPQRDDLTTFKVDDIIMLTDRLPMFIAYRMGGNADVVMRTFEQLGTGEPLQVYLYGLRQMGKMLLVRAVSPYERRIAGLLFYGRSGKNGEQRCRIFH
jgi:hypothetical protein